ncbi:zinc finger protein ZFAT-like [Mercenaria mercenaria]|uniref:zinc finger protein ZFAT-like n=1 Tax=Mercenaria mercenaria TaxID=6596 RepID=UPI00234F0C64|nr:zinc finger protein ZFAT-like [Mercenaria mercenaria]XP_045192491.2 zinc finger protein ZFAT-like [Mercenaria mercenaria]XP_045192492.2 zinc finger protein ZFAT-like [Mercenaria mercenaria]
MPLDTFICGTCMISFNDIEQFILHKNELCTKPEVSGEGAGTIEAEASTADNAVTNLVHIPSSEDMSMAVTDEHGNVVSTAISLPGSESLLANTGNIFQADNQQTVIILQGDLPNFNLENAEQIFTEVTQDNKANVEMLAGLYKKRGRPGRPKKVKPDPNCPKPSPVEFKEKNIPEIGEDGKLLCTRCKKSFTRERVFNAHKCLAMSEYVDFTAKEGLTVDPDDNHMPQDDIDDAGALDLDSKDFEYKVPNLPFKKHDPSKYKRRKLENTDESSNNAASLPLDGNEADLQTVVKSEGGVNCEGQPSEGQGQINEDPAAVSSESETVTLVGNAVPVTSADRNETFVTGTDEGHSVIARSVGQIPVCQVEGGPDIDEYQSKDTDQIGTIPLNLTEEEKLAFEAALNVDLSGVDHMFRVHCIEQELNSNVSQLSRFSSNTLSLYSCNTCDKVFKSLSHMRFHVLIHTELRPFKCIKCDYTSNARGNLYTHIRKHTGQFYKCEHSGCKFKTVNKSHLLEHSMTHSGEKHQCELCKKLYNTQKSLMSHIRKYHDNARGREYLSQFMQGRDVRGSTVIHQCHVCNRKFKKKTDRDRHLFVHDIKDLPVIKHCDLCDYSASRNKYLEKHFQKHRSIYRCCKCKAMFLSSIKLVEHLTTNHVDTTDTESWEKLFEESITNSLYLPEPDQVMTEEEKSLVNLPSELSESSIYQMKLQNSGEDDLANKLIDGADVFINKVPAVTVKENNADDKAGLPDGQEDNLDTNVEVDNVGMEVSNDEITENEEPNDGSYVDEEADGDIKANADIVEDTKIENEGAEHVKGEPEVLDEKTDTEILNEAAENATTAVVEETNLTDEDILGVSGNSVNCGALIEKLGYLPMTLQIFQKMRDTFGSEECEYCGRLFFSRVDYEPHVRTHTGDKPHVCQVCGFRAITKDNLKRHTDKEHEHISYPCRECSYVASTRTQLWNHTMKHKGLKGLECPLCQRQFDSIKELKSHAQVAHPNSNTEELDKILSYKHKAQGKLGRRSYKCPHCDKVFLRASSELQKHMWIHEGIKPFKCPLCAYACRSKNNLQAHMLRHSKDKPFLCGDCGKAYKSKTALRWHVRSHDGKLFKCDKCPYEATQRSHLKRHMETHDVIKKYVCGECKFSANTLGFLKVHYARFHKDININDLPTLGSAPIEISQDVNTFKCISCDYLFGNLTDLKRHLKTRHHVNVQEIQKVHDSQGNVSEVQVVHVEDPTQQAVAMEVTADGTQSQIVTDENLDEKTASAVNILQQIIGMSQNGSIAGTQQIDGTSVLQMNPETIIVQQDGSQMYVSAENTTEIDGNQYVIQYIPQAEEGTQEEQMGMIEVQGEMVEAHVLGDVTDVQAEIVTST